MARILVTGASGHIGGAIVEELQAKGHTTIGVSRSGNDNALESMVADCTDAGAVYGVLGRAEPDAIIHMGTIPGPNHHPAHVVSESNIHSAVLFLEAAATFGIEPVVLPSSINAIGSSHQRAPADIEYLPVDERHPARPEDPYGIAKLAMETIADGVGARTGMTITSLRYPWVADERALRTRFLEADRSMAGLERTESFQTRDVCFSYLHLNDAARIARLAVEADHDGHEVVWAVARDTSAAVESEQLIERFFPESEQRGSLEGFEALIDCSKAHRLLGWEPAHSWRELRD